MKCGILKLHHVYHGKWNVPHRMTGLALAFSYIPKLLYFSLKCIYKIENNNNKHWVTILFFYMLFLCNIAVFINIGCVLCSCHI